MGNITCNILILIQGQQTYGRCAKSTSWQNIDSSSKYAVKAYKMHEFKSTDKRLDSIDWELKKLNFNLVQYGFKNLLNYKKN